jgi:hypothetical protein
VQNPQNLNLVVEIAVEYTDAMGGWEKVRVPDAALRLLVPSAPGCAKRAHLQRRLCQAFVCVQASAAHYDTLLHGTAPPRLASRHR